MDQHPGLSVKAPALFIKANKIEKAIVNCRKSKETRDFYSGSAVNEAYVHFIAFIDQLLLQRSLDYNMILLS